jgi:hypothetical protein
MYFAEIGIRTGGHTEFHTLHDPFSLNELLHKGNVTTVVNAINDFKFEILHTHPLFDVEIVPFLSTIWIRNRKNELIFCGRVIDRTDRMGSNGMPVKEYLAECELAYLRDSIQRVQEFRGDTTLLLRRIVRRHNARVENEKEIHFVRVGETVYSHDDPAPSFDEDAYLQHISYADSFQNIKENLLERFGGYVWLEYLGEGVNQQRILCYEPDEEAFWGYKDCPFCADKEDDEGSDDEEICEFCATTNMPIRLAENLEQIKAEHLASQSVTRIVPLGIELNTPENAIRRLVAAGVIDNTDGADGRDYGQNVQWWKQNFGRIDPWMFQLLINLSRLNYRRCYGTCDDERCDEEHGDLFDDASGRFNDENNVRHPGAFSAAIDKFVEVGAIDSPWYWRRSGRTDLPAGAIASIANEDERIFLMRLRWIVRKAERMLTKCSPRLFEADETNSRLNLGNPNWIEVDLIPAFQRLERAEILLDAEVWVDQYENRFPYAPSPWMSQLFLALSLMNYDIERVRAARPYVLGAEAIEDVRENRQEQLHEGIMALARAGAIHNPEHWKEIYPESLIVTALLWMAGQGLDRNNPRSPDAGSSRNLFGTIVERLIIWENVACCYELWDRGLTWIRNRALSNSVSISALDMSYLNIDYERFKVGNLYRAENRLLAINREYRLIELTTDVVNPLKSKLTFGDRQRALSSNGTLSTARFHN